MSEDIRGEVRKLWFLNGEMTQKALAKRVGVSRQAIVAIEAVAARSGRDGSPR